MQTIRTAGIALTLGLLLALGGCAAGDNLGGDMRRASDGSFDRALEARRQRNETEQARLGEAERRQSELIQDRAELDRRIGQEYVEIHRLLRQIDELEAEVRRIEGLSPEQRDRLRRQGQLVAARRGNLARTDAGLKASQKREADAAGGPNAAAVAGDERARQNAYLRELQAQRDALLDDVETLYRIRAAFQ
jgi:hypothetical protein